MKPRRLDSERQAVGTAVLDVSALPTEVFGERNVAWWATIGFMIIEGFSLAVVTASYFYLRKNFVSWPPTPAPLPSLLIPTITLALLLVKCVPLYIASQAARRMDLKVVRLWMALAVPLEVITTVFRGFEFRALDVSYRDGVYGSLLWLILGFHTTLLVVDLAETATIAAMMHRDRIEPKHFVDVDDSAAYQYFLSFSMIPLYLVLYWAPRWF